MTSKRKQGTLPTSFSLSRLGKEQLRALSDYYGTTMTGVVEMLIRDRAREVGLLGQPQARSLSSDT